MPLSTPFIRQSLSLLACLCVTGSAYSQTTPPAWLSARAVGVGSAFQGGAAVDAAGNTYEAGTFSGTTTVAGTTLTSQGDYDAYLAKYTPTGTLAWVRQIGAAGRDNAFDVALDAAGNAYVTGGFTSSIALGNNLSLTSTTTAGKRLFVVRYSPQGTPEWATQSTPANASLLDGSGIATDAAGNVYVTGTISGGITIGTTSVTISDPEGGAFLARLNGATGTLQSLTEAFRYAFNPNAMGAFYAPRIAVAPTGETYLLNTFYQSPVLGGTTFTTRGGRDVLLAKYDRQGQLLWTRQAGGTADDFGSALAVDATGSVYLTTLFSGTTRFNTTQLVSAGGSDGALTKYSPQGVVEWAQRGGGTGADAFGGLALDAAGNAYVAGYFSNTATFNTAATATLTSTGLQDLVLASYTPQGQVRWVQQAGGPASESGIYLGLSAGGDVFVFASSTGTASFGPIAVATAPGGEGIFARLSSSVLSTQPARFQTLSFSPNPATNTLSFPALPAGTPVQLLDALGRVARTTTVSAAAQVSVQGLKPGLYTLRASTAQGQQLTGKVMVE
ncbi:SBBP repeat-containing protein [Hymenobacter cellulosivorans]|uniref:SBBP repeat-containing protein n=1 Tax=Hymenobacter cellulosivorans TaxID=2932249 RepID=A0ABY4F6C7_9BACT|nr:SBBP repeat-containing protein [Hymenobacter cellulosivorans]UOQ52224.1 SBBP repeat-containing protein [Hymenobacter cellulosivorans]